MSRLTLPLLALVFCCLTAAATSRAVIIGIGDYPSERGWHKINGDKDVPLVTDLLLRNGFDRQHIVTLVNEQATKANILRAFHTLAKSAEPGDNIYIHFSGHGQRITDLNGDEKGQDQGWDEAWIPYDASKEYQQNVYWGQNHLVDDELNSYLIRLRRKVGKGGRIVVVADACHSSGGTRAQGDTPSEETWIERGSSDYFILPSSEAISVESANTEDWIFFSACPSSQTNYEYRSNGSLTYALSQLPNPLSAYTAEELIEQVRAKVKQLIPFLQVPQLDCPKQMLSEKVLPK